MGILGRGLGGGSGCYLGWSGFVGVGYGFIVRVRSLAVWVTSVGVRSWIFRYGFLGDIGCVLLVYPIMAQGGVGVLGRFVGAGCRLFDSELLTCLLFLCGGR